MEQVTKGPRRLRHKVSETLTSKDGRQQVEVKGQPNHWLVVEWFDSNKGDVHAVSSKREGLFWAYHFIYDYEHPEHDEFGDDYANPWE